jgi:REP element-mobilizing transposase RayT
MTVPILVATPHAAFGELLRISLEEGGQYQVRLVQTAKEARASAMRATYQLAILDADLVDEPFIPLCYELISKPIALVIVPPDNNANHPSLGGLMPHGYLNRPFYLPDLLEMVEKLTQPAQTMSASPASNSKPEWACDSLVVKDLLEQELPKCEAVSILVGIQDNLLGSAGMLDENSAREMAKVLMRYWDPKEKTDLMRYVRLSSTKADFLAYATSLVNDLVLMMVFEPGAQLSQVRPQTKQVANNVMTNAAQKQVALSPSPVASIPLVGSSNGQSNYIRSNEQGSLYQPAGAAPNRSQDPINDLLDMDENEIDARQIDLAQMLGAIPSPDPIAAADQRAVADQGLFAGWFTDSEDLKAAGEPQNPGGDTGLESAVVERSRPFPSDGQDLSPTEPLLESIAVIENKTPASLISQPITERDPSINGKQNGKQDENLVERSDLIDFPTNPGSQTPGEAGKAGKAVTVPAPFFIEPEPEIDPLDDTRPHLVTTLSSTNQLEAVSAALSLLNYTCVLLPRMPQHYLTGELADRLAQWVQHLCLAFGWRLEGISLRPEYLQWTVQVAPSVSPGNLVRIIRQRTSLHIFSTFETIKQQNPSGDFWATGYLIVSGPQPPSAQLLREYIAQTRKRQGIAKL